MNKFKSLLCFVLLFSSACTKIDEKHDDNDLGIVDEIFKDDSLNDQSINNESTNKTDIIMNEVKIDEQENNVSKPNEQIKEQSKNEDKPNKPSSSIGKNDSS